jgi:DNA-3-methyladenine glycosylase II
MRLTIKPVPPFDFDLSAKIFSDGDRQIRKYENGKYWQVVRVNNTLILITITSSGTVEKPRLLVELKSNEEISNDDKKIAKEIISFLFDLKLNLKPFYEKVKNDKVMSKFVRKLRGLKGPATATAFEALVDSIIEQQISLNVANSLEGNVIKTFGDILKVNGEVYYVFPTPQKLASATVWQLRKCGLSQKKAEYIRDVSKLIVDGKLNLDKLKDYEDAREIVNELDKVRGIGVWTAELTMVRGMHKDAIPADDLGLRRHISHYYCNDRKISSEEARRIAEKWGKWKGLASFYLIIAGKFGIPTIS